MLALNANAVQQSLLKARLEIEQKLKSMVVGFAEDVVTAATNATPIGNATEFVRRYQQRQVDKGYSPVEGLAKGNWQYSENGTSVFLANYGTESSRAAISNVIVEARNDYKVGDTFYIANSLDYIGVLQNNYSTQTNGEGITRPALDTIMNIYKIDLKANYDAGKTR